MTGEHHAQVKKIFAAAVALDELSERARYIERVCLGKEQLRTEVELLLHHHQEAAGFMEVPSTLDGKLILHFRMLGKIGAGIELGLPGPRCSIRPIRRAEEPSALGSRRPSAKSSPFAGSQMSVRDRTSECGSHLRRLRSRRHRSHRDGIRAWQCAESDAWIRESCPSRKPFSTVCRSLMPLMRPTRLVLFTVI